MQSEVERLRAENERLKAQAENANLRENLRRTSKANAQGKSNPAWYYIGGTILAVCFVAKMFGCGPLARRDPWKDFQDRSSRRASGHTEHKPAAKKPKIEIVNYSMQTDISRQAIVRKQYAAAVLASGLEKHNTGRFSEMTDAERKAVILHSVRAIAGNAFNERMAESPD